MPFSVVKEDIEKIMRFLLYFFVSRALVCNPKSWQLPSLDYLFYMSYMVLVIKYMTLHKLFPAANGRGKGVVS